MLRKGSVKSPTEGERQQGGTEISWDTRTARDRLSEHVEMTLPREGRNDMTGPEGSTETDILWASGGAAAAWTRDRREWGLQVVVFFSGVYLRVCFSGSSDFPCFSGFIHVLQPLSPYGSSLFQKHLYLVHFGALLLWKWHLST